MTWTRYGWCSRRVRDSCRWRAQWSLGVDPFSSRRPAGLRSLLLLSPLAGEKFNLAPKSVLSLTHLLLTPLHEPPPRFLIPLLAFTPHLTRLNLFYPSCPTGSGRDFTRNSLAALDQVLGEVKALTLSDYTPEPEEGGKKWEMRASPSYILPACRSLKSLEIDVEAWSAIVPILQLVPTRLEALETTPSPAKEGVAMAMLEAMKCRSVQGLKRWRVTRLGKVEEEGEALREWREACGKRGIEVRDEKRYFAGERASVTFHGNPSAAYSPDVPADQISPTY